MLELGKRGGRPCVRNMRITVADVLGWLAAGVCHTDILGDYPLFRRIRILQAWLHTTATHQK